MYVVKWESSIIDLQIWDKCIYFFTYFVMVAVGF